MKAITWIAPTASVVILFGGIGIAQATGSWVTSGKVAVVAGQLTPDDLKGWMTLQQAADGLGLPFAELAALVEAPDPSVLRPETAFKDLEELVPDFDLATFRETVRAHLAARSGAAPAVTPSATPIVSATPTPIPTHTPTGTPTGSASGQAVTGQMTLRQVASANGIDLVALVAESGLPADVNVDTALRNLVGQYPGFEIQQVRDAVARLT